MISDPRIPLSSSLPLLQGHFQTIATVLQPSQDLVHLTVVYLFPNQPKVCGLFLDDSGNPSPVLSPTPV